MPTIQGIGKSLRKLGPLEIALAVVVMLVVARVIMDPGAPDRDEREEARVTEALEAVVQAQARYREETGGYARSIESDLRMTPPPGIHVRIEYVTGDGSWLATAESVARPHIRCAVADGNMLPEGYPPRRIQCAGR